MMNTKSAFQSIAIKYITVYYLLHTMTTTTTKFISLIRYIMNKAKTNRELHSYVYHNICSKIGGVKNTVGTIRANVKPGIFQAGI